jgi:hypothetical protein
MQLPGIPGTTGPTDVHLYDKGPKPNPQNGEPHKTDLPQQDSTHPHAKWGQLHHNCPKPKLS